jgi:hypothetical protein
MAQYGPRLTWENKSVLLDPFARITKCSTWILPWASVFVVSSTLAYGLDHALAEAASRPPQIGASYDEAHGVRESCLSAWARISGQMVRIYPQDSELFEAGACVNSVYVRAQT